MRSKSLPWLLCFALVVALWGGACSNSDNGSYFTTGGDDASLDGAGSDDGSGYDGPQFGGDSNADANGGLAIAPANQTIDVALGQQTPTVQYTATVGGQPVSASFSVDRGEIANIGGSSGVLSPSGNVGGTVHVSASYMGKQAATTLVVHLHYVQNGASGGADAGGGAGGNGGVGGEGEGGMVDNANIAVLQGNPVADAGLGFVYPYDKTVWPRGLLAPLLQWSAPRSYDAVFIHINEKAFDYQGYFAKTATPFVHHPVDPQAWQALAYSNAGDAVTVELVFAANGMVYGPLLETWTIAQGTLKGTVYYNSYGTNLAHNFCCTANGAQFGGATLAIKHGATDPVLVAGSNGGSAQCRVCHSVAAGGSTLITQHGDDYQTSSAYALTNNNVETAMAPGDSRYAFPAIYPDGTFLFSNSSPLPGINVAIASGLFTVPAGAVIPASGLPAGLQAGMPAFAPDGKHVAFNFYGGTGSDGKSLAALDFAKPGTFSNPVTLDTPGGGRDMFPSFLPAGDGVVFEREVANDGEFGATRDGSKGELWWVDLATKTPTRLDVLNGKGYLPTLASTNHADDTQLDYEPTVNPVPSGGYAWVVFTSRRLYGNVATIDPFWSDPRDHDISATPTTKKLWVAAIDLSPKAGTDPSHPAFYLPAQELLAGNSRGYWVVDPCQMDGTSCMTGDECCGGYCTNVDGGFVCTNQMPPCSNEGDKCTMDSDCCSGGNGLHCIGGRCEQPNPQ
jgi:hypothetical protein